MTFDVAHESLDPFRRLIDGETEPLLRDILPFMGYCPIVFTSAKTGLNVRKSVDVIDAVAANTRTELPTGMLNRTLTEATHRVVAPAQGGKRLRVYYAVQIGVAPVTVRLFVNDPKLATKPYTEFIVRSLRERFGLEGAPVVLLYRARTRPAPGVRAARRNESGIQPGAVEECPDAPFDDEMD